VLLCAVARSFLSQLEADVARAAAMQCSSSGVAELRCLPSRALRDVRRTLRSATSDAHARGAVVSSVGPTLQRARLRLQWLDEHLLAFTVEEEQAIQRASTALCTAATAFTGGAAAADVASLALSRLANRLPVVRFQDLVSCLIDGGAATTLRRYNPFLTDDAVQQLMQAVASVLLRSIRLSQVRSVTHTHTHAHTRTHTRTREHTRTHAHTHAHARTHTRTRARHHRHPPRCAYVCVPSERKRCLAGVCERRCIAACPWLAPCRTSSRR
jgi:hypothetical protein